MKYDLFNHNGIEKAAFFMDEHDGLSPKEIIRLFSEQFGEAVDPEELVMGLTIFFNVMPENFNEAVYTGNNLCGSGGRPSDPAARGDKPWADLKR
jgi:hypothetical protein